MPDCEPIEPLTAGTRPDAVLGWLFGTSTHSPVAADASQEGV
jgi:hypothetical protein